MRFIVLILLFVPLVVLSQTTIPTPSEIAAAVNYNNVSDSATPDGGKITKYDKSSGNIILLTNQIIGDFDGDGGDEVYLVWKLTIYSDIYTINSNGDTTTISGTSYKTSQFAVYSLKKNTHIIKSPYDPKIESSYPSLVPTGDLNGDGCIDYVVADKIYTTSTPIKKKAQ